jgi:hypothetical protein
VDKTGHFSGAFAITAAIMLAGGLAWLFIVGRLEQKMFPPEPPLVVSRAQFV